MPECAQGAVISGRARLESADAGDHNLRRALEDVKEY
jgi:hypothetical protein